MDSAKRRKSAVKWSAIFLLGLFAGVALMLPFVGNKNETGVNEMAELTGKVIAGNEIAEIRKSEEKEFSISNNNQKTIAEISPPEMKTENSLKEEMLASNESDKKINEETKTANISDIPEVSEKDNELQQTETKKDSFGVVIARELRPKQSHRYFILSSFFRV